MENKNYNQYGSYDTGYSAYEAAKDTVTNLTEKVETTELKGSNGEQNNLNKSKNYGFIGSTSTNKYSNPYDNNAYGEFTHTNQKEKRSSKKINKKGTSTETTDNNSNPSDVDVTQVQVPVVYYAAPQTVPALYYGTPVTPVTPVAIQYVYQDGSEYSHSDSSKGKRDSKKLPTSYFGDRGNVDDEVVKSDDKEKEYLEIMNELGIRPKDNEPQDFKSKLLRNQLTIYISALILFVILIILYFIWPRVPDITITDFTLQDEDPIQYKMPIDIEYRDEYNDLTNVTSSDIDSFVRFNLITHFDVKNNNYIPYKFNSLMLDYVLKGDALKNNVLLGRNFIENVEFKIRKKMQMTVTTTLAYGAKSMKKDDTFNFILQKCGITGKGSEMDLDYKMSVKIPMAIFTYQPSKTKSTLFECPFLKVDKYKVVEKEEKEEDKDKKNDDDNDNKNGDKDEENNKDKKNENGKENNQKDGGKNNKNIRKLY